jgi:putative hydrolase of the HAD superfamily
MLRAFIFDIGNVILRFDFQHAMRKLEQHCDPIADSILELIEPVKLAYEGGRMERADFQAELRAILRYTGTDADFVTAWEDIFTENEPMIRLIEALEPHYPLYLISNTSDIHVDFFLRRYPVFGRFRDAVYSYKVRASKPEREIYEIAARQFGVEPSEAFFIDDLAPNIASAAAVGFQTHHYHHDRHHELLERLKALGVEGV